MVEAGAGNRQRRYALFGPPPAGRSAALVLELNRPRSILIRRAEQFSWIVPRLSARAARWALWQTRSIQLDTRTKPLLLTRSAGAITHVPQSAARIGDVRFGAGNGPRTTDNSVAPKTPESTSHPAGCALGQAEPTKIQGGVPARLAMTGEDRAGLVGFYARLSLFPPAIGSRRRKLGRSRERSEH